MGDDPPPMPEEFAAFEPPPPASEAELAKINKPPPLKGGWRNSRVTGRRTELPEIDDFPL